MNLFKKSIESVSPKSALISGKYCQEVATDSEVDSLMKLHYKSCRSGMGLKTEMTSAVKKGVDMAVI